MLGFLGWGVLGGVLGAFPEAGALDVHSDVVVLGEALGQGDGVLSFAAAQLEDYGVIIAEDFSAPVSLQRVVLVQHLVHRGLDEAAECLVFLEFTYLVLSHDVPVLFPVPALCRRQCPAGRFLYAIIPFPGV